MNWNVLATSAGLLILSNVFMTFAWYAHSKELSAKPWWIAALLSWGVALFEYRLQARQPHRLYRSDFAATEDHAGADQSHGVRAVRDSLHEPAAEMGLPSALNEQAVVPVPADSSTGETGTGRQVQKRVCKPLIAQ